MDQSIPPSIPPQIPRRNRTTTKVIIVLFTFLFLFVLVSALILAVISFSMFRINVRSYLDRFNITVLEVKSEPNYFEERVRIHCEGDMTAGLWVTDMKQIGFFETNGPNGQIYYYEGNPHRAGGSATVNADGKFSTGEFLFRVTTTSKDTTWYDEWDGKQGSGSASTSLSSPLHITNIETNWPGSYNRGSEIPLANLGDYKVLISAK